MPPKSMVFYQEPDWLATGLCRRPLKQCRAGAIFSAVAAPVETPVETPRGTQLTKAPKRPGAPGGAQERPEAPGSARKRPGIRGSGPLRNYNPGSWLQQQQRSSTAAQL